MQQVIIVSSSDYPPENEVNERLRALTSVGWKILSAVTTISSDSLRNNVYTSTLVIERNLIEVEVGNFWWIAAGVRASLIKAGILLLEDLPKHTAKELLSFGISHLAIRQISKFLASHELRLRSEGENEED